jgi:predicted transport protein
MDNNMNLNQHKFMSQVPMSEVKKLKVNLKLGELVDIEIIGKATLIGCRMVGDFAYIISNDKVYMIIISLEKAKPYIKILYRS